MHFRIGNSGRKVSHSQRRIRESCDQSYAPSTRLITLTDPVRAQVGWPQAPTGGNSWSKAATTDRSGRRKRIKSMSGYGSEPWLSGALGIGHREQRAALEENIAEAKGHHFSLEGISDESSRLSPLSALIRLSAALSDRAESRWPREKFCRCRESDD